MKDFKKGGRFGGGGFKGAPKRDFSAPTTLHDATCAQCGKACQVPFRPNGKKPVFCKDCFTGGKADAPARSFGHSAHSPAARPPYRPDSRPAAPERRTDDLKPHIDALNAKIDALTAMVQALQVAAPAKKVKKAAKQ